MLFIQSLKMPTELSGWAVPKDYPVGIKKTKELTTYTTADGLPSNTIYAIQGDGKDFLWISTNAGISQFQKKNNKFINYYVSDGLQGNEFYKNASFKDKQGIIWFGGMNGITYFNPQDIINPAKHGISGLPTFSCITIRLEKE